MSRWRSRLGGAVFLVVSSASLVSAAVVIVNPSFESDPVAPGNFAMGNAGWTFDTFGRFRGAGDFGEGAAPTDGVQIAFLSPTSYARQPLTSTYAAGTDYQFLVDVAVRQLSPSTDTLTLVLYHSGNIANVVDSLVVTADTLGQDTFNPISFTATAAQVLSAGALGNTIGIGFANSGTIDFDLDNVRLNDLAVPEPATAATLLLILCVFGRRSNRP